MRARTGRYQHRSSANASHFSASFSVIRIACALGEREIAGDETVMVGKRVRRGRDAHRRELREEPCRMADAGQRVNALPREGRRGQGGQRIVDTREPIADERHREGSAQFRQRGMRTGSAASTTTASTARSLEAGSRNGPAGNSQPLPRARAASTTAISTSRRNR